jgi:hypothetical protein
MLRKNTVVDVVLFDDTTFGPGSHSSLSLFLLKYMETFDIVITLLVTLQLSLLFNFVQFQGGMY